MVNAAPVQRSCAAGRTVTKINVLDSQRPAQMQYASSQASNLQLIKQLHTSLPGQRL